MRCNSWTIKSDFTYLHYIYQTSSIQHYIYLNIPIYKKQENLIRDFILYTRNFLHEMGSRHCINNENETYALQFVFSYKYSTYQIFIDTCNIKITYQLMRRQAH